jgi:hypothetical protein
VHSLGWFVPFRTRLIIVDRTASSTPGSTAPMSAFTSNAGSLGGARREELPAWRDEIMMFSNIADFRENKT